MTGRDSTSWTLVRAAASGDADSREAFSTLYGRVIRAYLAARWRLPAEHEDVSDGVQEVFLQCFKPGGALLRADASRPGGFRAFLYGVTRNVAGTLEESRRRHARVKGEEDLDIFAGNEAHASQVFDRTFAQAITREARALLRERARLGGAGASRLRALELMYEHGLPSRAVAVQMGLDVAAVYPLLTRARKEFKAALIEVLSDHHPGEDRAALEKRCIEILSAL